jgi:hypothetical protein
MEVKAKEEKEKEEKKDKKDKRKLEEIVHSIQSTYEHNKKIRVEIASIFGNSICRECETNHTVLLMMSHVPCIIKYYKKLTEDQIEEKRDLRHKLCIRGSTECVIELHKQCNIMLDSEMLSNACTGGDERLAMYIMNHVPANRFHQWITDEEYACSLLHMIIISKLMEPFKFLLECGIDAKYYSVVIATECKDDLFIRYLHENEYKIPEYMLLIAAQYSNIVILDYILEHRNTIPDLKIDNDALWIYTCQGCGIKGCKYLLETKHIEPININPIDYIIFGKHDESLECLKYLHEKYNFTDRAKERATKHNHKEALEFMTH